MGARTAMLTNAQLLILNQWFSPAYPVGSFNFSHGLEWAVESGQVKSAKTLQHWLLEVLEHGTGQSDALFVAASYHAKTMQDLVEINQLCTAFAPSKERLKETRMQGAAFCRITGDIWAEMPLDLAYPVAVGWAAKQQDLPLTPAITLYLQSFTANLVSAAQRLAPIGQTEAQSIVQALGALCERVAEAALDGDLSGLSGTAFMADIASMQHETQYSRIFQT